MIQVRRPEEESDEVRFRAGDLVRHRRYNYRGVVVAVDLECHANEDWYASNNTQPRRDQPWYHVLVDGGNHTTYAAAENLAPDSSGTPIDHPLIERFFFGFADGRYQRNSLPWPV